MLCDIYIFQYLVKSIQLGRFKLRSNSDDEDDDTITSGSFFRQKQPNAPSLSETPKRSMAAACRDAREAMLTGGNSSLSNEPKRQQLTVKTEGESTPVTKIRISSECRDTVAASLLKDLSQTSSPVSAASPFPKMKEQQKQEVSYICSCIILICQIVHCRKKQSVGVYF